MELEKWLRDYDKVFLIDSQERSRDLLSAMLRRVNRTDRTASILFLCMENGIEGVKQISTEEYQFLWTLYHMYECSNRFQVITDSGMYGSLLNYVDTGLLTMEEAAEALLQ